MRLVRLSGFLALLAMPFLAVAAFVASAFRAIVPRASPAAFISAHGNSIDMGAASFMLRSVPRDVQNSLRHEAGQSKRSAARHT